MTWPACWRFVVLFFLGGMISFPTLATAEARAEVIDVSALTGQANLAAAAVGGRIVSVTPEGRGAERLNDGNLKDGWKSKQPVNAGNPAVIILELGGEATSKIDRIVLGTDHWQKGRIPREVEVSVSIQAEDRGFESVGAFTLEDRRALHLVRFAPVDARYVKIVIRAVHEREDTKRNRPAVGEILVLEAGAADAKVADRPEPRPPDGVRQENLTPDMAASNVDKRGTVDDAPTSTARKPKNGEDRSEPAVAETTINPARGPLPARDAPSVPTAITVTQAKSLDLITDDIARANIAHGSNGGRVTRLFGDDAQLPRDWEVSFFDGRLARVDRLIVAPFKNNFTVFPREVEIWASKTDKGEDFSWVARFELAAIETYQELRLDVLEARRLKVRIVSAYPGYGTDNAYFNELIVVEATGPTSILDGAFAERLEEITDAERAFDLASIENGGWLQRTSPDDPPLPHEVVLSFTGDRPATVGRVILVPFKNNFVRFPNEVEIWASSSDEGDNFLRVGRYLMRAVKAPQGIRLPGTLAKRLKIRVVSVHQGNLDEAVRFNAILAIETPRSGERSILAWPRHPDFRAGHNIALSLLGGEVISASSLLNPKWTADQLIDGDGDDKFLLFSRSLGWRSANDPDTPIEIVFGFRDRRLARISGVAVNPLAAACETLQECKWDTRKNDPENQVRTFDIWVTDDDGPDGVWRRVGGVRSLRFTPMAQLYPFGEAVEARFVKLRLLENYGGKAFTLGEVEIYEAPETDSYHSIVADRQVNIADFRNGGVLVAFTSQNDDTTYAAGRVLDGRSGAIGTGWLSLTTALPQRFTFAFRDFRKARISDVIINPRIDPHYDKAAPRRVKIEVSTDPNPRRGYVTIGTYDLAPTGEAQPISFATPLDARFLRLSILENHGFDGTVIGEVEIIEAREPGRPSVAMRWQPEDKRDSAPLNAGVGNLETDETEAEPNDSLAEAETLPLARTVGGTIEPVTDKDRFVIDLRDPETRQLTLRLKGAPHIKTALTLDNADGEEIFRYDPRDAAAQRRFTVDIGPGRYTVTLSQPATSIVLAFDDSGSMDRSLPMLRRAITRYINDKQPHEELAVLTFASKVSRLSLFTAEREPLLAVVKDKLLAKGGTALHAGVMDALDLLKDRVGNRAVILIGDGESSVSDNESYAKLWRAVEAAGVRIYTVAVAPEFFLHAYQPQTGTTGFQLLQSLAAATGGRSFFAIRPDDIVGIYETISRELRATATYTVRATASKGEGSLRLAAVGEHVNTITPAVIDLVMDLSGSMNRCLGGGHNCSKSKSRLAIAKAVLADVIDGIPDGTLFGLHAFGFNPGGASNLPSAKAARERFVCRNTSARIAEIGPANPQYRAAMIDWIKQRNHGGRFSQTAIGFTLKQVMADFPADAKTRKIILLTDGDDDCDAEGDPYYPPAVVRELRAAGVDVRIDIVGFDVSQGPTASALRNLAELGGGAFYDARNASRLKASLLQSLSAPFEVLDSTGKAVARGTIGGSAVAVPAGLYEVVIRAKNEIVLPEVLVRDQDTTLIEIDKEGDTIAAVPTFVPYEPPGTRVSRTTSAMVAARAAPADPAPASAPEASTASAVAKILSEAETHLQALRLTTPARANAFKAYQMALALDPENTAAKAGLVKIAEKYEALARRALARGDLKAAKTFGDRGAKVVPNHSGLMAVRASVIAEQAKQQRRQQAALEARAERDRVEQGAVSSNQRQDDRRRQALAAVDAALLGPDIDDQAKALLSLDDLVAIAKAYTAALEVVPGGETMRWNNPSSGNSGGIVLRASFQGEDNRRCRVYSQFMTIEGRSVRAPDTIACKQPNAAWSRLAR